jgi:hypothetical protein
VENIKKNIKILRRCGISKLVEGDDFDFVSKVRTNSTRLVPGEIYETE